MSHQIDDVGLLEQANGFCQILGLNIGEHLFQGRDVTDDQVVHQSHLAAIRPLPQFLLQSLDAGFEAGSRGGQSFLEEALQVLEPSYPNAWAKRTKLDA